MPFSEKAPSAVTEPLVLLINTSSEENLSDFMLPDTERSSTLLGFSALSVISADALDANIPVPFGTSTVRIFVPKGKLPA